MQPYTLSKLKQDPTLVKKLVNICTNYISAGDKALSANSLSYNVAHDAYNCYRSMTEKDIELVDRGAPRFYTMPMTANHISTMASFIAGTLFGRDSVLTVRAATAESEPAADAVNQLLRWNQEQQKSGMYQLGYLWIESALLYNKGIIYESWREKTKLAMEPVEKVVKPKMYKEVVLEDGSKAVEEVAEVKAVVMQKFRKRVCGFTNYSLVSPYDFISDPAFPAHRFQEGRFAGHRSVTSWAALKSRSLLSEDHTDYVFPEAVAKLKASKAGKDINTFAFGTKSGRNSNPASLKSRTEHERGGTGGALSGVSDTDKHDGGLVELHEVWVRLVPRDLGLGDGEHPELFRCLIGGKSELLTIEESAYLHDEFPYTVGEARPSAFYPNGPSWAIMLKPLQDMVDFLKDRHQTALAKTIGNIFVARSQFVDWEEYYNPEKEGHVIPITENTPVSLPLNEIVKQVELTDMTKDYANEVGMLMSFSEQITAASSAMQGDHGTDISATQFVGQMEMASGRLMTVARLLANQGLIPQTRRTLSNFQQFLGDDEAIQIKIRGNTPDYRPAFANKGFITVTKDTIQGDFDFVVEDITLPGTQTRQIAAATRVLEAATQFPQMFDPTDPTGINVKSVFLHIMKLSGLNTNNFFNGVEGAQAAQQKLAGPPPLESKDISALASLIKALKPEEATAVQPLIQFIFERMGIGQQPQESQGSGNLDEILKMIGGGGEPLEPSGGDRVQNPALAGLNDPGMPNVENTGTAGLPQVRPNNV
jgi:hypothetical protein